MQFNELLAHGFEFNTQIIARIAEGLTHADSLSQPPFKSNCFNWVLGHMIVSRLGAQELFALAPALNDDQAARYQTGTDPITADGPGVLPLENLLAALNASAESLAVALRAKTDADLDVVPQGTVQSLGQIIHGLLWHESYHLGQLELLRVVAGKDEKLFG